MKPKLIIGIVVGLLIVGIIGFLVPKLLGWLIGGALAGGATLATARKRRRTANQDHTANIEAETTAVEGLQAQATQAALEAQERGESPPDDSGTVQDRQAALDAAASRLR